MIAEVSESGVCIELSRSNVACYIVRDQGVYFQPLAPLGGGQRPYLMVLAIRDVEDMVPQKNGMRPAERALAGIAVWPVSLLPSSHDSCDDSGVQVDFPHDVV